MTRNHDLEDRVEMDDIAYRQVNGQPSEAAQFLTVGEVANLLRLKRCTIYKLVATRRIPFTKVTSRVLFDQRAIKEWARARSVRPLAPRSRHQRDEGQS